MADYQLSYTGTTIDNSLSDIQKLILNGKTLGNANTPIYLNNGTLYQGSACALANHTHDDRYSQLNHIHDDRYYTEAEINTKIPFNLGIDSNGNYGYIKSGADTITPFKLGEMTLLYTVSAGTGSTNPYEMGYTFTEDFYKSVIFIVSSDTDNNSDNFYKVCSQRHSEYATSSYGNYWNTNTDEWNYFKMSPPSGTGFPGTNSKYSDSNTIDKNKDIYWATGTSSANIFVNIAYKDNIKINDVVWLYVNSYRRSCSFIFGLK